MKDERNEVQTLDSWGIANLTECECESDSALGSWLEWDCHVSNCFPDSCAPYYNPQQ